MTTHPRRTVLAAIGAAVGVLALAACGGSSSGSSGGSGNSSPAGSSGSGGASTAGSGSASASSGGGAKTVSVQKIDGVGSVLVGPNGDALYFNNHGANSDGSTIACTGGCTTVWPPLTMPAGASAPSAPAGIDGKIGTVTRADGKRQVTWAGKPLFTFIEDSGPGTVTGDGATDSFGGTSFHWHVATASGNASAAGKASSSSGGGY